MLAHGRMRAQVSKLLHKALSSVRSKPAPTIWDSSSGEVRSSHSSNLRTSAGRLLAIALKPAARAHEAHDLSKAGTAFEVGRDVQHEQVGAPVGGEVRNDFVRWDPGLFFVEPCVPLVFRVWPVASLDLEFRLHRIRRVAARLRVGIAIALVVVWPLQVLEKISVRTVRPFVFGAIRPAKFVGYCAARHGDRRKHQRRARAHSPPRGRTKHWIVPAIMNR